MSTLSVIDKSGDSKLIWDAGNEDEVQAAQTLFDSLRKKGYAAYSVDKKGEKGSLIREFDPDAEKIILAPPMKGG